MFGLEAKPGRWGLSCLLDTSDGSEMMAALNLEGGDGEPLTPFLAVKVLPHPQSWPSTPMETFPPDFPTLRYWHVVLGDFLSCGAISGLCPLDANDTYHTQLVTTRMVSRHCQCHVSRGGGPLSYPITSPAPFWVPKLWPTNVPVVGRKFLFPEVTSTQTC